MLNNNYFDHTSLDGRTKEDRLLNGGISFGWSGENICYNNNSAMTATDVLNWCHSQFMSEPYPGVLQPHRQHPRRALHPDRHRDRGERVQGVHHMGLHGLKSVLRSAL